MIFFFATTTKSMPKMIRRRRRTYPSIDGGGLTDIIKYATGVDVDDRPHRVRPHDDGELPLPQRVQRDHPRLFRFLPDYHLGRYKLALQDLEQVHRLRTAGIYAGTHGDRVWNYVRDENAEEIRDAINQGQQPYFHHDLHRLNMRYGIEIYNNADPPPGLYPTEVVTPYHREQPPYMIFRRNTVLDSDSGYRQVLHTHVEM